MLDARPGPEPAAAAADPCLTRQLITYLGNKRKLLPHIGEAFSFARSALGTERPVMFDGFGGSGRVSRLMKRHAGHVHANDMEGYAATVQRCYLANRGDVDLGGIERLVGEANRTARDHPREGFVTAHYAPGDDGDIRPDERAFYTRRNAMAIDAVRGMALGLPPGLRDSVVAPLLVAASVHANTSGVFKGFHKRGGTEHFGGAGEDSLRRITGPSRCRCRSSATGTAASPSTWATPRTQRGGSARWTSPTSTRPTTSIPTDPTTSC